MKVFRLIGAIFFLIGLGFLIGSGIAFLSTKSFIRTAIETEGVVIELEYRESRDSDGSISRAYYPVVEFTPEGAGERIRFTSNTGSNPPAYREGDPIAVLYQPNNYYKVRIKSFFGLWGLSVIFLFMGAVFGGIGGAFLAFIMVKSGRAAWLRKNGTLVRAELTEVIRNYNVKINGVSPYQLLLTYYDNSSGLTHTFKSDNIYDNPEPYIRTNGISIVNVLVDPQNPQRYQVDLNFLEGIKKDNL